MWSHQNFHILLWECKLVNYFRKQFGSFSQLNVHFLLELIYVTSRYLLKKKKKMKIYTYKNNCTPIFTENLLIIAQCEKKPSAHKQRNR